MGVPAAPKYQLYSVAASALVKSGQGRIMYIVLSGHANACDAQWHDSTTNDNEIGEIHCPKEDTRVIDLQAVGGVMFQTGLYIELSGIGAHCFVWID